MELYERQLMMDEDKHYHLFKNDPDFDNLNEEQYDASKTKTIIIPTINGRKRKRTTKTKCCFNEEADLLASSSNRMPKIPMPPKERPQMKKHQVKPPSRNDPTQSFIIDKDCDARHSVCWN